MNEQTKHPIPIYLRKSFGGNSRSKIEDAIARAYIEGFTKEEIYEAFDEWLATAKI